MVSTSGWSDRWHSAPRYKSNVYSTQAWAQILSKILPHILYIFDLAVVAKIGKIWSHDAFGCSISHCEKL